MNFKQYLETFPESIQINFVVKIKDKYFSTRQPDKDLIIEDDYNETVSSVSLNPTQIDLKKAISSINTVDFSILDYNEIFTDLINDSENSLINEKVEVYLGFNVPDCEVTVPNLDYGFITDVATESEDYGFTYEMPTEFLDYGFVEDCYQWENYLLVNQYYITNHNKNRDDYTVRANSEVKNGINSGYFFDGTLANFLGTSETTAEIKIDLEKDILFRYVQIGDELCSYESYVYESGILILTGLTRGLLGTSISEHREGVKTSFIYAAIENPIDIMLKILMSTGNGTNGDYDVYPDGMGISADFIDIDQFLEIRDTYYSGTIFDLPITQVSKLIDFVKEEILIPLNLRLSENTEHNQLRLNYLNIATPFETFTEFNTDNTEANPLFSISKDGIVNHLTINWDYREGDGEFRNISIIKNESSIEKFGIQKSSLSFKGIRSDLNGAELIEDFSKLYLDRFSTPVAEIDCTTFFKEYKTTPGDKVLFVSPELPSPAGGKGMRSVIEVVSKAVNYSTGKIDFKLVFSTWNNYRSGYIAPSFPYINATRQYWDIPSDMAKFVKVGDVFRLYDTVRSRYVDGVLVVDDNVQGTRLYFEDAMQIDPSDRYTLEVHEYSLVSEWQKASFVFSSPDNGWDDGTKAYQIGV